MTIKIAIDAMGGDFAPFSVIEGLNIALLRLAKNSLMSDKNVHFTLYGVEERIRPLLEKRPLLKQKSTIVDCSLVIANDAKIADIIRIAPQTSLGKAVAAVAKKDADAVVSSGNTGAFMALSKIYLKTFEGIDRPAIPAFFPTMKNQSLMLDLGANIECSAKMLLQFALMGRIYTQAILKKENPTIGLLNIGSEATKGNQVRQDAARLLEDHPLINYYGFIEGTDISKGTVDIIVTDGFTGNIALKSIEGTSTFARHLLEKAFSQSLISKIAYVLMKPALKQMGKLLDQRYYNGAAFLGVKGIAVKSHGSSDALAFSYAVDVAIQMVLTKVIQNLEEYLNLGE